MTFSRLTIASLRRGTFSPSLQADSIVLRLQNATRTPTQQKLGSTFTPPLTLSTNAKYAVTRHSRQTRHSSAVARISPTPGWHYVIPAVVTQGGLAIFGPGIHLEARDLPVHYQNAKVAHPISYVKTEIIKEAQDPSFWRRLRQQLEDLWEDYVVHPVLTIWRFGVLALIFLPLIITVPAVFIGERNKELSDERSGTLWWYSLLVKHMELAGPTFIKVICCLIMCMTLDPRKQVMD